MPNIIEVTDQPDAADLSAIGNQLAAFNTQDVGPSGRKDIVTTVKDEAGELIAGLSGYTAWGWLYIQWLWVSDSARGQGLAGQMLAAAESEARLRGCFGSYIDTFSPIALKTYQRAGYESFGQLEEFPKGRTRVWLKKGL